MYESAGSKKVCNLFPPLLKNDYKVDIRSIQQTNPDEYLMGKAFKTEDKDGYQYRDQGNDTGQEIAS